MKKSLGLNILLVLFLSANVFAQTDTSVSGLFNAIKSESEPARMEVLLVQMQRVADRKQAANDKDLVEYSKMHLLEAWLSAGNLAKAATIYAQMLNGSWKDAATLALAHELAEKNKIEEAAALIRPYLDKTAPAPDYKSMMPTDYAPYFANLDGVLQYKKGNYAQAADLLANAKDPSQREYYVLALVAAGKKDLALSEANQLLLLPGKRSKLFLTGAAKLVGGERRLQQLLDSVAQVNERHVIEKMAKMKVEQPAPDFRMTDVNGKTVSLASLKGKTVILDFWATWCVPCVGSFPGMQRAVDYYAKDTSVVFLFIHTSERGANATDDAKRLLANKKYRFDLYMDLKDSATGKNPVAQAFGVQYLPTKFLIDKNGIIRFKNTGYVSEDEAIPEIKAMVDMANGKISL